MEMRTPLARIGRRLVIGEDIANIQETFGLTVLDTTYLMGNHGSRFYDLLSKPNSGKPIQSVSRCLLIRLICDWDAAGKGFPARQEFYNWPLLMPRTPAADTFNQMVLGFRTAITHRWPSFTETNIGILLGLSGTRATERWLNGHSTPTPVVQRMMTYLVADLRLRGEGAMDDQMHRIELEAEARHHNGAEDLLKSSRWNSVKNISSQRALAGQNRKRNTESTAPTRPSE